MNFDGLQSEKRFNGFAAFGTTKMANLVLTFDLAKRLDGSGVTVNAFHLGIVKSNIMGDAPVFIRWMSNLMGSTPDQPAADLANVTGKFFKGRAIIQPDKHALDENVQSRLWNAGLRLLGMQT